MGFGGISIWQLLIILAIVIMLFGTKRLRNIGGDLGAAIKGFKRSMNSDGQNDNQTMNDENIDGPVMDDTLNNSAASDIASSTASTADSKPKTDNV